MAAEIEKEKTYLLNQLPDNLTEWKLEYTKDIYLPPDSDNPQIRLRQRGRSFYITKKYPKVEGDLSTMIEETISLSEFEFDFLSTNLEGKVLEKNRYSKRKDDHIFEVDEYLGDLSPLKVLDIEWIDTPPTEDEIKHFKISREITQTKELAAGKIAGKSYSDISKYI